MSTNYPTSLDNSTTIPAEGAAVPLSTNHVIAHQNLQDAVEAIEAKVGANSSAVTTSHDYKLSGVTGTDKAMSRTGVETALNKTFTSPTITGATMTTSTVNGVTLTTAGSATDYLAANGSYVAGSVSNASTTAKGIVELATSAEITAGTATGGTGAALVVTPDALAASTPVFNASGLTGTMKKIVSTPAPITQIVSSTAETTIYTTSIAGGLLGSSNGLIIRFWSQTFNTSGVSITTTYRLKYGATTIQTYVETTTNGNSTIGPTEFRLLANASTSSQVSDLFLNHVVSGLQVDSTGTGSEDSTVTKNLVITAQLNTSSANARFDSKNYSIHLLA